MRRPAFDVDNLAADLSELGRLLEEAERLAVGEAAVPLRNARHVLGLIVIHYDLLTTKRHGDSK